MRGRRGLASVAELRQVPQSVGWTNVDSLKWTGGIAIFKPSRRRGLGGAQQGGQ
jgi:hypothetical protein